MSKDLLISDSGFFCGYFTFQTLTPLQPFFADWTRLFDENDHEHDWQSYQRFYYPGILNLQFKERRTYYKAIDRNVVVNLSEAKKVVVHIHDVRVRIFPYNLLIYSIHVSVTENTVEDTLQIFSMLRNLRTLSTDCCQEFYDASLSLIHTIYSLSNRQPKPHKELDYLVENGNKLKLFHIAQYQSPLSEAEQDNLLFSMGTLCYNDTHSEFASRPAYIRHELNEHRISVFNNWTGLALLDTFTILHNGNIPIWLQNNWDTDYFELLYLYQLYYKVYLYRLSLQHRLQTRKVEVLQRELDEFDRQFNYPSVSYNFLPNIIHTSIAKGLEIESEKQHVEHIIKSAVSARQEEREKKSNRFLSFLTILASFSAIWDICSFLDALIHYDETFQSTMFGYRLVGSILMLMVCLVALLNKRGK